MSRKRAVAFWAAVALQLAILVALPMPRMAALRGGRTVLLRVAPVDPYNVMSGYYATLSYDASMPGAYFPVSRKDAAETTRALMSEYLAEVHHRPTRGTMGQLDLTPADLDEYSSHPDSRARDWRLRDLTTITLFGETTPLTSDTIENIRWRAQFGAGWNVPGKSPFRDGDRVYAVIEERGPGEPWKPTKLLAQMPAGLPPNQVVLRGTYGAWRITFGIEEFHLPEVERHDVDAAMQEWRRDARAEIRVDRAGRAVLMALHVGDRSWPARW